MPSLPGLEAKPRDYLKAGDDWPDGDLEVPDDPTAAVPGVARFARYLAQRLRDALKESGKTKYRIAKDAGIHRQTVTNILNGDTWPNLTTIYRLEVALEHRLWHNEDFRRAWQRPAHGGSGA